MSICSRAALLERQISHVRIVADLQARNGRMSRYLAKLEMFSRLYNEDKWEYLAKRAFSRFRSKVFDDTGIDITIMDL